MADGFEPVAVRVGQKCGVVGGVVVGTQARQPAARPAMGQPGGVDCGNRRPVRRAKAPVAAVGNHGVPGWDYREISPPVIAGAIPGAKP